MIMIRFDILTVFPEMFTSPFQVSLLKKAQERGLIEIGVHNIRDHALDRHRMTDDAPYGGGCGMVMKVEPIDRALSSVRRINERSVVVLLTLRVSASASLWRKSWPHIHRLS